MEAGRGGGRVGEEWNVVGEGKRGMFSLEEEGVRGEGFEGRGEEWYVGGERRARLVGRRRGRCELREGRGGRGRGREREPMKSVR